MNTFLANIEKKIQALLEDGLDRLMHPGASYSLSAQLIQLIQDNIQAESLKSSMRSEQKIAPDLIKLHVPFERWDAWQTMRPTLEAIAQEIEKSYIAQGYCFERHPHIQLLASESLPLDKIEVSTAYHRAMEQTGQTSLIELQRDPKAALAPEGACFIFNGKDSLPLQKAIIHIGRHSMNDIVIQDPMVSREHLQLRAQRGRYLLFDLSSTGGTFINGKAVHHATLKPGDVVKIGNTVLIYNQDLPDSTTKTTVSFQE